MKEDKDQINIGDIVELRDSEPPLFGLVVKINNDPLSSYRYFVHWFHNERPSYFALDFRKINKVQ